MRANANLGEAEFYRKRNRGRNDGTHVTVVPVHTQGYGILWEGWKKPWIIPFKFKFASDSAVVLWYTDHTVTGL